MNSEAIIRKEMIMGKFRSKLTFIFGTGDLEDVESIIDFYEQKLNQLETNIIGVETEKDVIHSQNLELKAQVKYYKECANQLETNRDEAIEYIKNHIHQETYTGYMDAKELMKLVSLLERGKE